MYGKHFSDDIRKKWSELRKGKSIHTEESKIKISEAMKGENNPFYGKHHSEETKAKISKANKGKIGWNKGMPMSEEQKAKLSAAKKGIKLSKETCKKMSESHNGEKNYMATMVLQCDMQNVPICIWGCIEQASKKLNINRGSIGACCRGDQKTAGGYKWFYVHDKAFRDGTIVKGAISLGMIIEEEIQCLKY